MFIRLWEGSEKYIDRYYLIGKYAYDIAQKILPSLKDKIIMTGWPRVDLWRPDFLKRYNNNAVKNIKDKYGDFILISSDFGYNSENQINEIQNQWKRSIWKKLHQNLSNERNFANKVYSEYEQFVRLIHDLDKRDDVPQIIIRPHPSEDIEEWKKFANTLKRIKVIYEGEVSPWIYASSGVLHRGCTTSVQAYMAGIKTGFLILKKNFIRKALPYQISEHLYDLFEIIEFCKTNIGKKAEPPNTYSEKFMDIIHIEKKTASELICEDFLRMKVDAEQPYSVSIYHKIYDSLILLRNMVYVVKQFFNIQKINSVVTPKKILGGITKNEIHNILKNFDPKNNIVVKQSFTDCVEIEKK